MNNIDKQYTDLLQDILDNGVKKETRNGGTISVFGRQIRHKMSDGFPLLTTKKMSFKTMVTELLWFLRGDTNIKYLVDNDCHIWDGDAYKNYTNYPLATIHDHHTNILYQNRDKGWCMLNGRSMVSPHPTRHLSQEEFINKIKTDDEFAKKWGELGPVYGKQWRNWMGFHEGQHDILKVVNGVEQHKDYLVGKDQIWNLINDLKTNPDSRRLIVSAWNVGELDQMVLPPCHYGFQVYTRELSWKERWEHYFYNVSNESCLSETELDKINYPKRAISLMYNARSQDVPLGTPFNIASYGLLLEIIGKMVNMVPDELITNMGDCHIYLNQIEPIKEQIGRKYTPEERELMLKDAMSWRLYNKAVNELMPFGGGMSEYYDVHKIPYHTREPFPLPTLKHMKTNEFYKSLGEDLSLITHFDNSDFELENYQSHPTIKIPLSN